ncbi:hypothetical protein BH11BAC1_BH11BAC1_09330 [soil metagenome]
MKWKEYWNENYFSYKIVAKCEDTNLLRESGIRITHTSRYVG